MPQCLPIELRLKKKDRYTEKELPKKRDGTGRGPSLQLCAYTFVQSRARGDVDCRSVPLSRTQNAMYSIWGSVSRNSARGNDARAAVWVEKRPKRTKKPSPYQRTASLFDSFRCFTFLTFSQCSQKKYTLRQTHVVLRIFGFFERSWRRFDGQR